MNQFSPKTEHKSNRISIHALLAESDTQGVFNLFANPGSTELTFPGFGLEINGVSYDVWADTNYNLSDLDDKFGGLLSVVRFATSLLVYLALIRYLINTYHRIFGEGD